MRVFFAPGHWLAVLAGALVLGAVLLLPFPYRDGMLVAVVVATLALALVKTEEVWLGVLALLPLFRLSGELFSLNGITVPRLLVLALTVIVVVKYRDAARIRSLLRSNGFRFFGLFVVANLISAIHVSQLPAFFVVLTYLEPLLFFAISYYLVASCRLTVPRLLHALLIGAALVAVVAVYEVVTQQPVGAVLAPHLNRMLTLYMSGFDSNRFGLGGRVSSLIAQPVFASLYWVLILTLALYFFQTYLPSKWLQLASVVVCVALLLLTATRSGLLALAAALLVLVLLGLQTLRQRILAAGALLAGSLLLAWTLPNLAGYLRASLQLDPNSNAAHNILWRIALTTGLLQIFRANWFLGNGPGLVQKQAAAGLIPPVDGVYPLAGIENQYATILADGGIVAGITYLLFMGGVIADGFRMWSRSVWRTRGTVLLALFAAYFVFAAAESTLIQIPNLLLMAVYGAFAADFERAVGEPPTDSSIANHV